MLKKTIIGLIVGGVLFWVLIKVFNSKPIPAPAVSQVPITDENIDIAVSAFKDALNKGEDQQTLDALNEMFKKDFGISIKMSEQDNSLIVRNMAGNNIKIV
jgi:hypothetical protein